MKTLMKALGVLLMVPYFSYSQSDEDLLRYSQITFGEDCGAGSGAGAVLVMYKSSEVSLETCADKEYDASVMKRLAAIEI
jgi:hypothetical protein